MAVAPIRSLARPIALGVVAFALYLAARTAMSLNARRPSGPAAPLERATRVHARHSRDTEESPSPLSGSPPVPRCCNANGSVCYTHGELEKVKDRALITGLAAMDYEMQTNPDWWDEIGADAAQMFTEMAISTISYDDSDTVRALAMQYAKRYVEHAMKETMSDPTFELVAQLIILRWQLGWMDTADTKKLITMGDNIYKRYSKDERLQAGLAGLTTLDLDVAQTELYNEDKIYELIVTAYDLGFASSIASDVPGKERWPLPKLKFETLYETLIAKRKYMGVQYDASNAAPGFPSNGYTAAFQDSAYLASHLPMFMSGYNTGPKLDKALMRDEYDYLESLLPGLEVHDHLELISEIIDQLRGTGEDEFNSPTVCKYTHWILERQQDDGSWFPHKYRQDGDDGYDVLHVSWTAVLGIRSRHYLPDSPWHTRMTQMLEHLTRGTGGPHVGRLAHLGTGADREESDDGDDD